VTTASRAGDPDRRRASEINRVRWDALAELHGQDSYYDTHALVSGRDSLTEEEDAAVARAVGDVGGLDVLHVQCHIGFDSISLTRRGARVCGVDFSSASLRKAETTAQRCGVSVEWVQADVTDLPTALHQRFDLAYATVGVLCWIDDLSAWMRSVAAALRPGGRLVLIDGHPLMEMMASVEPLVLDMPYADDGGHTFVSDGSYAVPEAALPATAGVYHAHSLGEVVGAALAVGLRIDELTEHLESSFEHRRGIARLDPDGRWRLRVAGQLLPMLFTLRATRVD